MSEISLLLFVLVLSIFLGYELIFRVPAALHTPLMSGANAISGITMVGALIVVAEAQTVTGLVIALTALFFATINVVGGYVVTDRMLGMFGRSLKRNQGPSS